MQVTSCSNPPLANSNEPIASNQVHNLEVEDFNAKLLNSNGILLDVRTQDEISQGYISGASFINFYDESFTNKINFIQKDKPVFVYCKMGGRSAKAAQQLLDVGFKEVYNLNGGIQSWYNNGNSITQDSLVLPISQEFSLVEFESMINQSSLPNLICFQTKWCLPCKQMNPILSDISVSLKNDINIIKIDLDKNLAIAKQFNIESVPTFIGMTNSTEKWRRVGFTEKKYLVHLINQLKK